MTINPFFARIVSPALFSIATNVKYLEDLLLDFGALTDDEDAPSSPICNILGDEKICPGPCSGKESGKVFLGEIYTPAVCRYPKNVDKFDMFIAYVIPRPDEEESAYSNSDQEQDFKLQTVNQTEII